MKHYSRDTWQRCLLTVLLMILGSCGQLRIDTLEETETDTSNVPGVSDSDIRSDFNPPTEQGGTNDGTAVVATGIRTDEEQDGGIASDMPDSNNLNSTVTGLPSETDFLSETHSTGHMDTQISTDTKNIGITTASTSEPTDTSAHTDTHFDDGHDASVDQDGGADTDTRLTGIPTDTGMATDTVSPTDTALNSSTDTIVFPTDTGDNSPTDSALRTDTAQETDTETPVGTDTADTSTEGCDPVVDLFPTPIQDSTSPFPEVDDSVLEVSFGLSFTFDFYGQTYSEIYLNTNGGMTFVEGETWRHPAATLIDNPGIAVFWSDLDADAQGAHDRENQMVYQQCPDRFIITYTEMQDWFEEEKQNSAKVTLYTDGAIEFRYGVVMNDDILMGVFDGTHTDDQYMDVATMYLGYASMGTGIILFDDDGLGPTHVDELNNQIMTFIP